MQRGYRRDDMEIIDLDTYDRRDWTETDEVVELRGWPDTHCRVWLTGGSVAVLVPFVPGFEVGHGAEVMVDGEIYYGIFQALEPHTEILLDNGDLVTSENGPLIYRPYR